MKIRFRSFSFAILSCFALISSRAAAQVPQLVSHQGRVLVGNVNFTGVGHFKFALMNAGGTATLWSNDGAGSGGAEPGSAIDLTVTSGLYSVLLGDTSLANMTALPTGIWTNPDIRLRVWFDDGTHGSQLLTPDQRLAPVSYLADGAVTASKIAPGTISGDRLSQEYAVFEDRKPSGTDPDPGNEGRNTRVIGSAPVAISGSSISLVGNNAFTLQPGVYFIEAECPASQARLHKAAIFDSTDLTTAVLVGSSAQSQIEQASGGNWGTSNVWGYINVSGGAKTYLLRHYVSGGGSWRLGIAVSSGQFEVYARLHIVKIQ